MPITILLVWLAAATPATGDPASTPQSTPAAPPESALRVVPAGALPTDTLLWRLRPIATVVARGDGRGQALEPGGVAADAFGRLVVTDAALHRMQRFEPDGRWLGEAGSLGSDAGQFRRPGSVVMLGALAVAILDHENRRVERYDLFGRRLGTLVDLREPAFEAQVGRVDPVALAADRGGALFLADADRDRVLAFDFAGRYLRTIGGFGGKPGSFRGLGGLAVAAGGGLVTAERGNARVQRLDAGGRVTASWLLPAARSAGAMPVAVDDSGRVAVADETDGRLWVFDPNGRTLAALAGLARPRALAFAPDGTLLVAEAGRGEVRRFALERTPPPDRSSAPDPPPAPARRE